MKGVKGTRSPRRICGCGARKGFYAKTCRKCMPPQKPLLGKRGVHHPAWKGGTEIDRDGYVKRYAPDHPWPRKNGYVREHVRTMKLHIGRRIQPGEAVHHVDHDRTNNAIENLDTHRRRRDEAGRFV